VILFSRGAKMYRTVEIGKKISGADLEKILIAAGKEMGLRAKTKDHYRTEYHLGSVQKKTLYYETDIALKRSFLPVIEISGIHRELKRNWFAVRTGLNAYRSFYCFGTGRKVEEYLNVVSKLIQESS